MGKGPLEGEINQILQSLADTVLEETRAKAQKVAAQVIRDAIDAAFDAPQGTQRTIAIDPGLSPRVIDADFEDVSGK